MFYPRSADDMQINLLKEDVCVCVGEGGGVERAPTYVLRGGKNSQSLLGWHTTGLRQRRYQLLCDRLSQL